MGTLPAMKLTRTHLAASGTAAALGVLTVVALGAADGGKVKQIKAVPKAPPVEVRTVVVHRTVRVVKHAKPKKPEPVATPPAPAATAQPVRIVPASQTATAPAPSPKPLSTRTSGGASGSGERESSHEDGGGEHEGYEGGDD